MKTLLLVMGSLVLFAGACEKKSFEMHDRQADTSQQKYEPAARHAAPSDQVQKPLSMDLMFDHWTKNRKEDVAVLFLEMNWECPVLFSGHPVLSLSENDFLNLNTDQQQKIGQQAISIGKEIREITRFIIEQAKTTKAEKKFDQSKQYHRALIRFADSLDKNDMLLLIQQIGKAVKGLTQKELGDL